MRNSASTTSTTTRVYLDADVLLNGFTDGLLPVAMGPDSVREADFADDGLLVWIGTEVAVTMPIEMAGRITLLARNAGWHTRVGHHPEQFGIQVRAFVPDYLWREHMFEAKDAWDLVRATVGLTEQD